MVSQAEVMDTLTHLALVDVTDPQAFHRVLRANFAKSRRDQPRFDHLFHLFFHEFREDAGLSKDLLAPEAARLARELAKEFPDDPAFKAALDFMAGDPLAFLEKLRALETDGDRPAMAMGGNLGQVARRLEMMLAAGKVKDGLLRRLGENPDNLPWQTRRELEEHFLSRLDAARRLISGEDRPLEAGAEARSAYEKRLGEIGERSFVSLTPKEVAEMREVIDQLVRKLKDLASLRYSRQKRGVLDVKKTLRKSGRYLGVPMELVRRNKPPKKGKIVTLCDVSGSVWSAARFMLNMLYSLQECFTRVRSYVFVAGLAEVTGIFEDNEISRAIDKVLAEAELEYGAPTDYGATFRQFSRNHMEVLNKKTTLIIIGDGRSNYLNPELRLLEEMREKCRRVIWLNPEAKGFWYSGDSEMRAFETRVNEVRPCQNLNQLTDFIQDLIL